MALNAKNFETKFNEYLSKLVYATFADIEREWNSPLKYDKLLYMCYSTLLLDKKARPDGLKSRFTISSEVRQYLTRLFSKMIEEFENIKMVDGDDITTVIKKLLNENTDCYSSFMFELGARYKDKFGPTLSEAGDTTLWWHGQIVGFLPQYSTKPMLLAIVSNGFDMFLKAIAWLFGKFLWYYEASISSEMFLGLLAQQSLNQLMLDELSSGLRARVVGKSRSKKVGASVSPAATTTPVTVDKKELALLEVDDIAQDVINEISNT
jgi:hypothetical protein